MGDLKFLRKLRGYDVRFAAVAVIRTLPSNEYYLPGAVIYSSGRISSMLDTDEEDHE
jgi:hypothetical protein